MNQGFQQFLQKWYKTPSGQTLFKQESALVESAISNLFGYYLVQLGCSAVHEWMHSSRVSNKLILDDQINHKILSTWQSEVNQIKPEKTLIQWVKADLDFLPLAHESTDVVVLPHTLETVSDPYYLLRQVDAVLVPEGHLVLTGFNPLACAIIKTKVGKDGAVFRKANLTRSSRVVEWLTVLGYEIEKVEFSTISCFSGTTERDSIAGWRLLERSEQSLSKMGLQFGNVYCIVARKHVDSPKWVGAKWKKAPWLSLAKGRQVVSNRLSKNLNQSKTSSETDTSHPNYSSKDQPPCKS